MSRFYDIQIFDKVGGSLKRQWTSLANGLPDPAALQVELDVPVTDLAIPLGAAQVTIWGIPLTDVSQGSDFNGMYASVYGGMSAGLPLANPRQQGLLLSGLVQQCFGTWVQNQMMLNFVITSAPPADVPQNLVFHWTQGASLSEAITNTLAFAFPNYKVNVSVRSDLVISQPVELAFFQTAYQFSQYLQKMTSALIGGDYPGVSITLTENAFNVFDGSTPTTPVQVDFQDLIGQPTWIEPGTMQFNTVMRADLSVGAFVHMPSIPFVTTPQSYSQYRDKSSFGSDGRQVFQIKFVRHVGNSRGRGGESWISTFNCSPAGSAS